MSTDPEVLLWLTREEAKDVKDSLRAEAYACASSDMPRHERLVALSYVVERKCWQAERAAIRGAS